MCCCVLVCVCVDIFSFRTMGNIFFVFTFVTQCFYMSYNTVSICLTAAVLFVLFCIGFTFRVRAAGPAFLVTCLQNFATNFRVCLPLYKSFASVYYY